jgi:hypothetical protein
MEWKVSEVEERGEYVFAGAGWMALTAFLVSPAVLYIGEAYR